MAQYLGSFAAMQPGWSCGFTILVPCDQHGSTLELMSRMLGMS